MRSLGVSLEETPFDPFRLRTVRHNSYEAAQVCFTTLVIAASAMVSIGLDLIWGVANLRVHIWHTILVVDGIHTPTALS